MGRRYTREEIAANWDLFREYVDPDETITREEFEALTLEEALKIQDDCFGTEKARESED